MRFAKDIRKQSGGGLADKWHFDEAVVTIKGRKHLLWRRVDQEAFCSRNAGAKPPQCQGCKTPDRKIQRFVFIHDPIADLFYIHRRHRQSGPSSRTARRSHENLWRYRSLASTPPDPKLQSQILFSRR